jgi:diadenosine tetraphosphate (Ap4A) HIT family hydrolase
LTGFRVPGSPLPMQTLAEFRAKFRVEELRLYANSGWTVSLRPAQCTLGACVISANRFHASLGSIDAAEAADLADAAAWFERAARAAFGADKVNHLALMMVDDHLHFHALPRYAGERRVGDLVFTDAGWPKVPDLTTANPSDDAALQQVLAAMRGAV